MARGGPGMGGEKGEGMLQVEMQKRTRVLDPIERVSEIIFGLIMALSFTGSVSAATAGREEIRTMMFAALGCNLAWGLVDAVMYLVGILTERTRNLTLLRRVRSAVVPREAQAILADAFPGRLGSVISAEGLEDLRQRLAALPEPPTRGRLGRDDFVGALGVFLIVVLTTFLVVSPGGPASRWPHSEWSWWPPPWRSVDKLASEAGTRSRSGRL
jgi:hypothetical protein